MNCGMCTRDAHVVLHKLVFQNGLHGRGVEFKGAQLILASA